MGFSASQATWALFGAVILAVPWACASPTSTSDSGFEELPGSVGGAGGESATSTSSTSTSTTSTTSTSAATTSAATSTSAATTSATTTSTSSGGPVCNDAGPEPNETEGTATGLPDMEDCDPSPLPTIDGTLDGPGDVDWFKYTATDAFGCSVDPTRDFTVFGSARLCKYAKCTSGGTSVTCNGGSTDDNSPAGSPGCCANASFSMDIDCSGTISDDATVYIRVDQANGDCVDYSIDYHY